MTRSVSNRAVHARGAALFCEGARAFAGCVAASMRLHAPEALAGALAISLIAAEPAYAYVDPSVMTYAIQALAGVVVALSAVAGVAFRKTRRALLRALGVDENAHKEVEPPVHRMVDGKPVPNEGEDSHRSAAAARKRPGEPAHARIEKPTGASASPRWLYRIALALAVWAFACFTLLIVAPFEIVAMSSDSLMLSLEDVAVPVIAFAVALAAVGAVLTSLLRGRAFSVVLLAIAAFGVASWMQAMFLNEGLPLADGASVAWSDHTTMIVVSAAVWAALLALAVVAAVKFERAARTVAAALSVALIVVQGVGLASVVLDPDRMAAKQINPESIVCTEDGLFELSPKSNIVVLVLDTFDTDFLEDAFADDPSLREMFDGFTLYRNSTGTMIPTRYGVPYLITGEWPRTDETYWEFIDARYRRSNMLTDIYDAGYSIGLYSDSLGLADYPESMKKVAPLTMNLHPVLKDQIDPMGTVGVLAKCALYRDMPWLLKPLLWFTTDEVNNAMVADDPSGASSLYLMDDIGYYKTLRTKGLALTDDSDAGAFRMIHLLGYHYPYIMNERGEYEEGVTPLEQSEGSLRIVGEYLDQMKQLGVFDDATIIVTADHGKYYLTETYLNEPTSPMILYKPSREKGDSASAQPLRVSNAPVSQTDIPPTIIGAAGGDASVYGSGAPVDAYENADPLRRRLYCMTTSELSRDIALIEYAIEGDVSDLSNWHLTGNEWWCVEKPAE